MGSAGADWDSSSFYRFTPIGTPRDDNDLQPNESEYVLSPRLECKCAREVPSSIIIIVLSESARLSADVCGCISCLQLQ